MDCASEPHGIAAGAEPRTCRANVASPPRIAPPLLRGARAAALALATLAALAAPAQAQTTTVTQSGEGATWSLVGENTVAAGQQTYTYTLTRTSGSQPQNEYFGFTSDTLEAERFQDGYSDCTGTNYFCFTLSNSFSYSEYTVSNVRFAGRILRDTSTQHVLTLKVATGTPTGTTVTLGVVSRSGIPRSGGLLITVGAATNTAATGAPTITGTAQVGETLTAVTTGITDADGLTSPTYTYQWIRVDGTEADIAGENSSTYTLVAADLGKTIKVKVSFDDDASNTETLTSDATATVTGVVTNNAPVFSPSSVTLEVAENTSAGANVGSPVQATDADATDTLTYTLEGTDADDFDIVSTSGQIRTKTGVTYDYEAQASYSVSVKADDGSGTSNATATAAVTIDLTDESEPPLAPNSPELAGVPGTFDSLSVHWDPPGNAGRPAITGYDIRYARPPESFGEPDWEDGPRGVSGTTATLSDLDAGVLYLVAVRAVNAEGEGAWSDNSGEFVFRPPVSSDCE